MKFILFLMLFTTPPAEKGQEVWSLQNSTSMEFDSFAACSDAVKVVIKSIDKTDTVRLYGWCFPKAHKSDRKEAPGITADTPSEIVPFMSRQR